MKRIYCVSKPYLVSGGYRISTRRGRQLPGGGGGGANIRICRIFPKTAWNWKNLDSQGGRASPAPPLDPPLLVVMLSLADLSTNQLSGHWIYNTVGTRYKFVDLPLIIFLLSLEVFPIFTVVKLIRWQKTSKLKRLLRNSNSQPSVSHHNHYTKEPTLDWKTQKSFQ